MKLSCYIVALLLELELELIQPHMTKKPMLRGEESALFLRLSSKRDLWHRVG